MIDIRSDTVTTPTDEMRRAMAAAEVGDDVYGEDPTVNRLEALGADMTGQPAGLFVASGTMANLCALLAHTERGDEFIVGAGSHIFLNEVASAAVVGGLQARPIDDSRGHVGPDQVEAVIRGQNIHWPRTRLVCLENTHNTAGGVVMDIDETEAVLALAREHSIKTHLDGARLFNAATYLGVSAARLGAGFDSVYICLSKGLGAPVGSLLCGRADFIERARKYRKMLGGGMRQAGIIAAAGIIALEKMTARLAEDHAHARHLAEGLSEIPGIEVDPDKVQTNIVFLRFPRIDAAEVSVRLAERGVLASPGAGRMRLVTHHQVTLPDVEQVIAAFREVFSGGRAPASVAGSASAGSPY